MSSSTKPMKFVICLEILLLLTSTMAEYRQNRDSSNRRYCGRILTESLSLICNGEYEQIGGTKEIKRADELIEEYAYADQPTKVDDLPLQYQQSPLIAKLLKERDIAIRPRVRREWMQRRGVYDECCRKPCSFNELRSYCKKQN